MSDRSVRAAPRYFQLKPKSLYTCIGIYHLVRVQPTVYTLVQKLNTVTYLGTRKCLPYYSFVELSASGEPANNIR